MYNYSFLKSLTLPGGITKKTLLVSPIWTWICTTILTHSDYKNEIRCHEKPKNLDSTWSNGAKIVANFTTETNQQRFIGQN